MQSYKENIFFKRLLSLNLPPEDYAIFGSGPMAAYGLKDLTKDIDVIAKGKAWEKAKEYGEPVATNLKFGDVVSLFDGTVEIFNGWPPAGTWDIEKLIDEAEVVDGIKFVRLETVAEWKGIRGRPGDEEDIKKIQEFLQSRR